MKAYLAYLKTTLRLTLRERSILFFGYVFPLIFFFIFAFAFRADRGSGINLVFAMIVVIGTLGNGLFGGGIRMVTEREANILRRFKVAPISPAPILVASIVVGLLTYLPSILLTFSIAHFQFGMKVPERWPELLVMVVAGIVAFRAIGLIVASVANSMAESQILTQLLYFPLMFLSGAAFPREVFPAWLKKVSEFIPATHLATGVQGIIVRGETLAQNTGALFGLVMTTAVALFVSLKLFRWEKEEKLKPVAKLWVLASLAPFFLVGAWELKTGQSAARQKQIDRELARTRTRLFQNARIVTGDGRVIPRGSILVREGKIAEIFVDQAPDAKTLKADEVEAAGKTIIPGLIDAHVHLGAPGGYYQNAADYNQPDVAERALAAYLYSGVTAVRSTGDWLENSLETRGRIAASQYEGAELLTAGPLFTAPGGHPTQMLHYVPENMRKSGEEQFVRLPASADEARRMVRELKKRNVNLIKGVLEAGWEANPMKRMDVAILRAAVEEAKALGLPVAIHTGSAKDVADAIEVGATSIEHGSMTEALPAELFTKMKERGIALVPTLCVAEGMVAFAAGDTSLLDRPLLQQAAPAKLLRDTKAMINQPQLAAMRKGLVQAQFNLETALENVRRARAAGVMIVTGSDAGNPLVVHGPTTHHEMALLVRAGLKPAEAIQAATSNAARLLGIAGRTGTIAKGQEATFLVLDANPLEEISATERISTIMNKGERVARPDLLTQKLE